MDKLHITMSKAISYALRHRPEEFGLKLDADGSVKTEDLIGRINAKGQLPRLLTIGDIDIIIAESDKKRFEFSPDRLRIRAVYGHSTDTVRIRLKEMQPPKWLYHGTENRLKSKIFKEGLKPMNRQYVHLSDDVETATIVGKRRDSSPLILKIDAEQMFKDGYKFGTGNDHTWMVDSVPSKYISINTICEEEALPGDWYCEKDGWN